MDYRLSQPRNGYGLIGLLIVVAIIGVLAVGGLYMGKGGERKSSLEINRDALKRAEDLQQIVEARNRQTEEILENNEQSGELDSFAKCLKDEGAVFFGAFWCSHCGSQKKLFGTSAKYLNYVECSTSDGNGRTKVCEDKNIESYPTWEFADGSRQSGEVSLEMLAEKTSCNLF